MAFIYWKKQMIKTLVGVNFGWVKLLAGEKYLSPLKNWSLFNRLFFSPTTYKEFER